MALETPFAATICRMVSEGLGVSLVNPIVSRTMRFPGVVAIPFKPDIPFRSHMPRAQPAPRGTYANYFAARMRAAFDAV